MSEDPDWYVPGEEGKMQKSPLASPFPGIDTQRLLDINWRRNVARGGYGMIAQLRSWLPDPVDGIYWVYQDNQTVGPYVPIYAGVQEINPLYKTYNPDQFNELL
jgi:dipeptidase